MKKILLLTIILLGFADAPLYGQPTFYLTPDDTLSIAAGDTAVFNLHTRDFTELMEVHFSLRWDPAVANLVETGDFHPDLDIDPTAFNANNSEGYLTFAWHDTDPFNCDKPAVSIPDSSVVFSVSLVGIAGQTQVFFSDDPLDVFITRTNACPQDIVCFCDDTIYLVVNDVSTQTTVLSEAWKGTNVYPNPSSGQFRLSVPPGVALPDLIRVLDIRGGEVQIIDQLASDQLHCRHLAAGLYFLEIYWENDRREVVPIVID